MKWAICDRFGAETRDITTVALDKTLKMRKSRPCLAEFKLPASLASGLSGHRTLKVWRDEPSPVLRFAGRIMQIHEDQQSEAGTVTVRAADFFQKLFSRFVMTPTGLWRRPATPTWTNITANLVITEMVDRSIAWADNADGTILGISGGTATANTLINAGPFRQEKIGKAIVDICDMGIADVWMEPQDVTNGLLNRMHVYGSQGSVRSALFQYGVGLKNVASFRRTLDITNLANDVTIYGENYRPVAGAVRTDASSISTWGRQMDARFVHQIADVTLVGKLADLMLSTRKAPRETISFEPVPQTTGTTVPQPFTDYFLGDTVTFEAGGTNVREPFSGQVRVHGFTVLHENDGAIRATDIQLSANG